MLNNPESGKEEWEVVPLLVHEDQRGLFYEAFKKNSHEFGANFHVKQVNVSTSNKGVFRGMHLTLPGFGQKKYVFCASGRVLDFALDVRIDSPSFGQVWKQLLVPGGQAVYIPNGFAHGFLALEDNCNVVYLCDNIYLKEAEISINPLDDSLELGLSSELSKIGVGFPILSDKDSRAPSLEEARKILERHKLVWLSTELD
jgi:dTDP-4-dehydrorhamnose 3,5-epimerase